VKKIRYYKKEELGKGSFGEVHKAVDVDSGEFFALKLVKWPDLQSREYTALKRDVEYSAGKTRALFRSVSAEKPLAEHREVHISTGLGRPQS